MRVGTVGVGNRPRGQRVRRYLRQAQEFFALDGARVILSQAVSHLAPNCKSTPSVLDEPYPAS